MSEKIRLTKKQILFLMEMTELDDPDKAAEQFQKLMILEKVDPSDLVFVLNKVMEKAARSLK